MALRGHERATVWQDCRLRHARELAPSAMSEDEAPTDTPDWENGFSDAVRNFEEAVTLWRRREEAARASL